jgi:uncharacterized coiled-coil protein SlyX
MMSEFQKRCWHFYRNLKGGFNWPNSREGDLLKIGYKEIEELNDNSRKTSCPEPSGKADERMAELGARVAEQDRIIETLKKEHLVRVTELKAENDEMRDDYAKERMEWRKVNDDLRARVAELQAVRDAVAALPEKWGNEVRFTPADIWYGTSSRKQVYDCADELAAVLEDNDEQT